MEILVFKTNIQDINAVKDVAPHLNSITGIIRWNIDLNDIDNILRIESSNLCPRSIEEKLIQAGFLCEELTD